ncbi:hypothetical protein DL765_011538 [Monosporascus sp. GIB2]|nr:hypothetical protein DL765_011538 [Monosporascus sp. GIB2]
MAALAELGLVKLAGLAAAFVVLLVGSHVIYNLFFIPLRQYPGSLILRATRLGLCYKLLKGTLSFEKPDLHKKYGEVPIIKKYIDLLIRRLHENCEGGAKAVDMVAWYNYTAFDQNSDYHVWVKAIFQMARVGTLLQVASNFPALKNTLLKMVPKRFMEVHENHMAFTSAKLSRRMEAGNERPDLVEGLLRKREEWGLTVEKLRANSSILIVGGSETTATLLTGGHVLPPDEPGRDGETEGRGPHRLRERGRDRLRERQQAAAPPGLLGRAVRTYPPVPVGLPRVVPKGSASVSGQFVPADAVVAVHQWAMYHNDKRFNEPFAYRPGRRLGDPLAYIGMRLILARVLWNFDMKISDESRDRVFRQKVSKLWRKGALNVYLTPVAR